MKTYKGKAIYNPSGKAGEYSYWACNFYTGCSNGCDYCYCKKGLLAGANGSDVPKLKKGFRDEEHAMEVFRRELLANVDELRKHGLFFSFTTDPMLPETIGLTFEAINALVVNGIPVKILTKRADWVKDFLSKDGVLIAGGKRVALHNVAFGFTLTGQDDREPGASTNAERIKAMQELYYAGFKTWASIEPVLDYEASLSMLWSIRDCCHLAKVGLESGRKYGWDGLREFVCKALFWARGNRMSYESLQFKGFKVYFKDSLLKQAGIDREDLNKRECCCVNRDYNIFKYR